MPCRLDMMAAKCMRARSHIQRARPHLPIGVMGKQPGVLHAMSQAPEECQHAMQSSSASRDTNPRACLLSIACDWCHATAILHRCSSDRGDSHSQHHKQSKISRMTLNRHRARQMYGRRWIRTSSCLAKLATTAQRNGSSGHIASRNVAPSMCKSHDELHQIILSLPFVSQMPAWLSIRCEQGFVSQCSHSLS